MASATAQEVVPLPEANEWVGVFNVYPAFVRMTLRLAPSGADGELRGEMRMEPGVGQGGVMGVVDVVARYDGSSRRFEVDPVPNRQVPNAPKLRGVYDPERGLVGGVLASAARGANPYFVLASDAKAAKRILDAIEDNAKPGSGGRSLGGIFSKGGTSRERILEWANRLVEEYPEISPYQTEQGGLFYIARALFRDDHFREYFGKPFDELGRGDLQKIQGEIRKITPPRANFPEERANGAALAVSRGFVPMNGTYTAADITLAVAALRPMRSWWLSALRQLTAIPAEAGAMATVARLEAIERETLETFWPSERATFAEAVARARGRIAGPELAARVDATIASATTFADAIAMSQAMQGARQAPGRSAATTGRRGGAAAQQPPAAATDTESLPALLALVTDEVRNEQRGRLEAKVNELVVAEIASDRKSMESLGAGLAGLETGGRWYAAVTQKYASLGTVPSVQALLADFATRRSAQIRASEGPLSTRIEGAASTREVATALGTYLGVPSDRADPVGARLLQVAQQRQGQLAAAEQTQAQERAQAAQEARSACARLSDSDADVPNGPSTRDMCRAIEDRLTGADKNVADMKESCGDVRPNGNPMTAMLCLMGSAGSLGGGPQISVRSFRKIACVAAHDRPGFSCDYLIQLRTANTMMAGFMNRIGGEIANARFVGGGDDWMMVPNPN